MNLEFFNKNYSHIINSLKTAKRVNKLPHAYLVFGDNVEIRNSFAKILAGIFACENREGTIPCEKCAKCIALQKGTYYDLHILEPASKSRKITIGKENEANTMRWFQARFYLTSVIPNAKKIGIIFDADRLVIEAQNAFLKTLEEPPINSHLILVSGNKNMLLPTILSRCQLIPVVTNKISYDFKYSKDLFSILEDLLRDKNSIQKASNAITAISEIFNSLNQDAKEEVTKEWKVELNKMSEMDSAGKKQLTTALEAAISSSYLFKRNEIIDGIYCWIAELYHMSLGVDHSLLSNPEIISPTILSDSKVTLDLASKFLKLAEKFTFAMKFNVDEDLAIHELVMNLNF